MTEATHRLIFLGIQNHKLERRVENNERRLKAIVEENGKLTSRLQRFSTGDERQSGRLILENVTFFYILTAKIFKNYKIYRN